jgi:hypothetical protein
VELRRFAVKIFHTVENDREKIQRCAGSVADPYGNCGPVIASADCK